MSKQNYEEQLQVRMNFRAAFQCCFTVQEGLPEKNSVEFDKIAARPTDRADSSRAGHQNVPKIEIPRNINIGLL